MQHHAHNSVILAATVHGAYNLLKQICYDGIYSARSAVTSTGYRHNLLDVNYSFRQRGGRQTMDTHSVK